MVDCTPPIILLTFGEPGFFKELGDKHPIFKLIESMIYGRIPGSMKNFSFTPWQIQRFAAVLPGSASRSGESLKDGSRDLGSETLKEGAVRRVFFTEQHPGGFRWLPTKNMSFFGGGSDVECFGGWKLLDYGWPLVAINGIYLGHLPTTIFQVSH